MDVGVQLTPHSVATICQADTKPNCPIVQVLNLKCMEKGDGREKRIRLVLSDGEQYTSACMAASQTNAAILDGGLSVNDVISLDDYLVNQLHHQSAKQVVVVVGFTVLWRPGAVVKGRGGCEPRPLSDDDGDAHPSPRPPAQNTRTSSDVDSPVQPLSEQRHRQQPPRRSETKASPLRAGATVVPSGGHSCRPISSLIPYQTKWTIRARVIEKMDNIKVFHNSKGEAKLFSFGLVDETGEIHATAYNKEVDRFFNLLQEDNTYYISGGTVKSANKRFTSIKNDYELCLEPFTEIKPCMDAAGVQNIPKMSFNFTPIDQLPNCQKNTVTDVIGVVKSVEGVQELKSKKGEELRKRDLTLLDATKSSIQLTLWGKEAESFQGTVGDVVAVKGCRVGDFGGVSLSAIRIHINPDIEACRRLKGWYDAEGCHETSHHLTTLRGTSSSREEPAKLIEVVELLGLGSGATKWDYFSVRGTVSFIRPNESLYLACPMENCRKKVMTTQGGQYRCEKCQKNFDKFKYGFIMSLQISDFTGSIKVTLFEDQGKKLLGMDASELGDLRENNEDAWLAVYNAVLFKKFIFRIGARTEDFQEETRMKYRCFDVHPMDLDHEIRELETLVPKLERLAGPSPPPVAPMDISM